MQVHGATDTMLLDGRAYRKAEMQGVCVLRHARNLFPASLLASQADPVLLSGLRRNEIHTFVEAREKP